MIPRFAFTRPTTLEDAFGAFAAADGEGRSSRVGRELLQVMKMGFAQFGTLIDLKGLPELRGIQADGRRAADRGRSRPTARSSARRSWPEAFPGLVELERGRRQCPRPLDRHDRRQPRLRRAALRPGDPPARRRRPDRAGRAPRDPHAVDRATSSSARSSTARDADEILTAVLVPPAAAGEGRAYGKLAFFERPAASVAVRLTVRDGAIASATVAVGSISEMPEIVDAAGAALVGVPRTTTLGVAIAAAAAAFDAVDAVEDLNGAADYKRHLAGVLWPRPGRPPCGRPAARGPSVEGAGRLNEGNRT